MCNACLGCDILLFESYFPGQTILELLIKCLSTFSKNINTLDLVLVTEQHFIELGNCEDFNNYAEAFERLGGVYLLETLTNHKNSHISEKVNLILNKFMIKEEILRN